MPSDIICASDRPFDDIDFGPLPAAINRLLQQGVRAHRTGWARADRLFRAALARDRTALPTYFCLYKIHSYAGRLDDARTIAQQGSTRRRAKPAGHRTGAIGRS